MKDRGWTAKRMNNQNNAKGIAGKKSNINGKYMGKLNKYKTIMSHN